MNFYEKIKDFFQSVDIDTASFRKPEQKNIISIITPDCYYNRWGKYWIRGQAKSIILNDRLIDDQSFKDKVWRCFKPIHPFLEKINCEVLGACLEFCLIENWFGYIDRVEKTNITFDTFKAKLTYRVFNYMMEKLCYEVEYDTDEEYSTLREFVKGAKIESPYNSA